LERGVIVEIDGAQHAQHREYDRERTKFLEGTGFVVLRFWNDDVLKDEESVLAAVGRVLADREGWRWGSGGKRSRVM